MEKYKKNIRYTVLFLYLITIVLITINLVDPIFGGILLGLITLVWVLYELKPKEIKEEKKESNILFDEEKKIETKQCPVCKTVNNINRKYCKKCNNNIQNIICPVCETKNPFDSKYCSNCDSILQNTRRF